MLPDTIQANPESPPPQVALGIQMVAVTLGAAAVGMSVLGIVESFGLVFAAWAKPVLGIACGYLGFLLEREVRAHSHDERRSHD